MCMRASECRWNVLVPYVCMSGMPIFQGTVFFASIYSEIHLKTISAIFIIDILFLSLSSFGAFVRTQAYHKRFDHMYNIWRAWMQNAIYAIPNKIDCISLHLLCHKLFNFVLGDLILRFYFLQQAQFEILLTTFNHREKKSSFSQNTVKLVLSRHFWDRRFCVDFHYVDLCISWHFDDLCICRYFAGLHANRTKVTPATRWGTRAWRHGCGSRNWPWRIKTVSTL